MGSLKPDGSTNPNSGSNSGSSGTTFTNGGYSNLNDDPQNKPLPTIVYIHGESYEWNSGNPYDGSVLAAHGNVIIVTINFRLGVLGFLKTGGKGSAQGNFGLMDLVAGLHWLRENLPAFGGDPNKVTIMGHGTGAALANILIVSPVASDLIHRAILLSGSALSPWAIQRDPLFVKRRVAEHTGCHGDLLVDDLAPCLRTKPIEELLQVKIDSPRFLPGFAPFVDGTVIAHSSVSSSGPLTLPVGSAIASTTGIELADFPTRELIFGLTSIESYLDLSAQDLEFGFNETRRDRILRTYVRNVYHYHLNEIYAALKNEYTDWERPLRNPLSSRDASLEFLSDGHTAAPLIRLGYLHSLRGGRTYFLHFKHQSGERDFPQRSGSLHGEDVPFCLGLPISPLFPYNYTKQDIKISRALLRYISNFALTGNPNDTPMTSIDISHNIVHTKSAAYLESSSLTLSSSLSALPQSSSSTLTKTLIKTSEKSQTAATSSSIGNSIERSINAIDTETSASSSLPTMTKHHNDQYFKQQHHHLSPFQSEASKPLTPLTTFLTPEALHGVPQSSINVQQHQQQQQIQGYSTHTTAELSSSIQSSDNSQLLSFYNKSNNNSSNSNNNSAIASDSNIKHIIASSSDSLLRTSSGSMLALSSSSSYTTVNKVKKSKRHVAFFQSASNKVFKRRKRKATKRLKRKNLATFGGITDTTGISNNSNGSTFYRKRYSSVRSNVKNVNAVGSDKIEKPIRHNMQNDQGDLDDDEDEEDEEEGAGVEDEDDEDEDDDEFTHRGNSGSTSDVRNQHLDRSDDDNDDSRDGNNEKFDRFTDDINNYRLPFWDTYDAINQLYLDLGNKVEIRNHYRGHKLSMWLSLIPQLHSPGDLNELPMRHHHFPEDSAQYYDGIIRPQITQRPAFPKPNVPSSPVSTTTNAPVVGINIGGVPATTTECPPNTTIVPTIAATRPQNHQQNGSTANGNNSGKHQDNISLLRRLVNGQYQSYTTALIVTISVGCFLLLLNILIFAGIYYQREKRLTDAKKKEELREAERCSSPTLLAEKLGRPGCSGGGKGSRKSSLQSLTGYNSSGSFGEYSCYDEKLQCKEKHALADICSVELPLKEFKCTSSPNTSNTGSLRRNTNTSMSPQQQQQQPSGLLMYPPSYQNPSLQQQNSHKVVYPAAVATAAAVAVVEQAAVVPSASDNSNGLVQYSQFHKQMQQQHIHHQHHAHHMHHQHLSPHSVSTNTGVVTTLELCNQSTQSDQPTVQDVGTTIDEKTVVVMVSGNGSGLVGSSSIGTSTGFGIGSLGGKKLDTVSNGSGSSSVSTSVAGSGITVTCGNNDDDDLSPDIPEPPPPPKSAAPYQGGILRQPGPPTTPASNKKRVQIQEISV